MNWLHRNVRPLSLVLIGLALLPAYLRAYELAGPSDIPTVLLGDKVIVNHAAYSLKLPYSDVGVFRTGSLSRGDFVLLRLKNHPRLKSPFFKRVIGLPGEVVEVRDNQVIVDGHKLPLKALSAADFAWVPRNHPIGSEVQDEDGHWITFTPSKGEFRNHGPVQLRAHEYFVLGDNRDYSEDSRVFGPVDEAAILGKVIAKFATGPRVR
ncbi:MAG: signal peptidase I [Acidobacteria bacterium]|nr:signal peptidase I [Acidobacteriota bacterium]